MLQFARNSYSLLYSLHPHSTKYFLTFESTFAVPWNSTGALLRAVLLCENGCMKTEFHLKCAFYGNVTGVRKMLKKKKCNLGRSKKTTRSDTEHWYLYCIIRLCIYNYTTFWFTKHKFRTTTVTVFLLLWEKPFIFFIMVGFGFVSFGLFFHPLSHTCNTGHVSYIL